MKRQPVSRLILLGLGLGGVVAFGLWYRRELLELPARPSIYFHLDQGVRMGQALHTLADFKIIRNNGAVRIYGWLHRAPNTVKAGTYIVNAGMTADEILQALDSPVHQKFRFPETNWARRNANLLERDQVTTAREYLSLVNNPRQFDSKAGFPLPDKTLEGYLYPDTYDLPPLTGAERVVERQLRAFKNKVVDKLGLEAASEDVVCKASLVELETGTDEDRAMIAGVIENRLKKGMPLQIDAGIEYSLGKWRRLYFKDYKNVKSPYNLYLHKGLPPTPICSPSLKSIEAVLHPAHHEFIYYVALPNGHSIYAKTPAEHEHNIRVRKLALEKAKKDRAAFRALVGLPVAPAQGIKKPGTQKP